MPTYFAPGSSQNATQRLIKYGAITGKQCICNSDDENKVKKDSTDYNKVQVSTAQYRANLLKIPSYGGSIRFGSTGEQRIVNYLGRVQGQPGGSGTPPRNRF